MELNKNVLKMMELAASDEALIKKFSAIHDPDEAYALAISIQDGYTKEEFVETMAAIHDSLLDQDLTSDDLSKVSGGSSDGNDFLWSMIHSMGTAAVSGIVGVIVYAAV